MSSKSIILFNLFILIYLFLETDFEKIKGKRYCSFENQ